MALRRVRPAGWWFDGLLLVGFVGVTLGVSTRALIGTDVWLRNWCDTHRPEPLYWVVRIGNLLGQGSWLTGICLVLALLLAWRRHSVRPVLPVVVAFVLTFGTLTPLKRITDRPAPHVRPIQYTKPYERGYFNHGGSSYPSGHLTNSIVWYGVLALLLVGWLSVAWRRAVRIVPPVVLSITTVYIGYHWLTDTVAGVLLGLFLGRLMGRIPWDDLPLGRRLRAAGWDGPALDGQRAPDPRRWRSRQLAGRRG